jgi:hypothetical protein
MLRLPVARLNPLLRHTDVPAAAGGERRAETALLARRREHRDRMSDASL